MRNKDKIFMKRCIDIAKLGLGFTSPNPSVGAVIVHQDRIVGEGYHHHYGEAHAEVNAVNSVKAADRHLLPHSTLYVSLEPCSIFGRTPPCVNLIIDKKIPRVVIAGLDRTPGVNGNGIKKMLEAGIEVVTGILEREAEPLNNIRNTFVSLGRPYVILKYAQSRNHKIARFDQNPVWISNKFSKRLVHKWRAESDAIMVGTNTAELDNPRLNNRLHFGPSPIRVVFDQHLRLPPLLHLFNHSHPTIVFTDKKNNHPATSLNLSYVGLTFDAEVLKEALNYLHSQNISSLLVEGGAQLLTSFIEKKYWDEARVLTGNKWLKGGIDAPVLSVPPIYEEHLFSDKLQVFHNKQAF